MEKPPNYSTDVNNLQNGSVSGPCIDEKGNRISVTPESDNKKPNKFRCDGAIRCRMNGENTHKWIGTIAGVITVISGVVATLVIFVGGSGGGDDNLELLQSLVGSASARPPKIVCECPNGVGALTCKNDTLYNCVSCEIGFTLKDSFHVNTKVIDQKGETATKVCTESCSENEVLNEETNRCESTKCTCKNGEPVIPAKCETPGLDHCEGCDHREGR